jgi:GTP cyclohydrolase II
MGREGRGAVVYLRQEGRSIGLANKIRAYALQAAGADTVDANRALGLPDDARRYDAAAAVLKHLGVKSVRLMTNNPAKVEALSELGVEVRERVSARVLGHPLSRAYIATKQRRMRHALR